MSWRKLFKRLLTHRRNVAFADVMGIAAAFGFSVSRIKGSHHILKHPGVPELVNLQNVNGQAKPYQIGQLLDLIERYGLTMGGQE